MARGNEAKLYVQDKIKEAFGEDYLGITDKKIYVLAPEDGEKIQIAIALTAPKNTVSVSAPPKKDGIDFEKAFTVNNDVEISPEERAHVQQLLNKLNL